ncbi:MAG: ABC transporter permease [Gammaproteobacteria bacterium]
MSALSAVRPYSALFASRFQLMLQYRGAAVAGFLTQCWWGGLKVMILAAFYGGSTVAANAPMTFPQAVTYTWIAQALLALLPWMGDPDVASAVRTGAVSYDRLRPLDFYSLWFARAAGWIAARVVPRLVLMFGFAALLLPLLGFHKWSWRAPSSITAAALFVLSLGLALLLSSAVVMLINIAVAASMNPRGANALIAPPVIVLSGNLLPLSLFPDELHIALLVQPFAGLLDIPLRIYFGGLSGPAAFAGLAIQMFWIVTFIALGRWWLARVLRSLEMQGG